MEAAAGQRGGSGAGWVIRRFGIRGGGSAGAGGDRHRHGWLDTAACVVLRHSGTSRPTYGRCSRWGVVAFASSLDQPGPFARTVRDCAILLRSMAGHDRPGFHVGGCSGAGLRGGMPAGRGKGLRIGVPQGHRLDGMPEDIERLWQQGVAWLRAAGAEVVDVSLPHTKHGLATYYIVAPAECSSNLARYDGVRFGLREPGEDLRDPLCGAHARRVLALRCGGRYSSNSYVLSAGYYDAYYVRAQKVRCADSAGFHRGVCAGGRVTGSPTAPSAAFAQGEIWTRSLIKMYFRTTHSHIPSSMAGCRGCRCQRVWM